jgi:hypothetical protein
VEAALRREVLPGSILEHCLRQDRPFEKSRFAQLPVGKAARLF